METIVKMAADTGNIAMETREKAVATVTAHIWDAIEMQRSFLGNFFNKQALRLPLTNL